MARNTRNTRSNSSTKPESQKTDAVSAIVGHSVFVKVKRANNFSRNGIEIGMTKMFGEDEDPNELIDTIIADLDGKADEYMSNFPDGGDEGMDDAGDDGGDEDMDDAGDDGLTEDEINGMTKKELIQLIKDEDLDVTASDYKKIDDLREAVCDAYFADDSGSDDGGDEGEEGEEGDDGLTEDEIMEMDRKDLLALIKEEGLEVNPKEFKKTSDLAEAVCDAYFADDNGGEEGYTEDEIMGMDRKALIALIKEEGLEINPRDFKKTSDLAEEVCAIMLSEDFGDFDNTEGGEDE